MTLVSIITPSYNQAAFLEKTIQSVLAQTGAQIEYIIIDGGSRDGSVNIIQRYAGRLAYWVSEPDSGQAEAINKGLQRARGEIVAWLNSDDLYLPGAVSSAVAVLEQKPELGMVFGDAITIDAAGRPLNRLVFGNWGLPELMRFRIICQPSVFMRRSALEKAGYLDPDYHFLLDHHLWLRIASLAPIQHVSAYWSAARYHPAAKNVAQAAGFGKEAMRIFSWMEQHPQFAGRVAANRRQILGGVHRLNARYLLDGDLPGPALLAYMRALRVYPRYALQHWHRMIYALLSLVGLKGISRWYYQLRNEQRKKWDAIPGLDGWPGLVLEDRA